MKITLSLLALVAALGARAEQPKCGSPEPSEAQIAQAKAFFAIEQAARANGNATSERAGDIVVQTYFHVVAASQSTSGGYLSQSAINSQLAAMNTAYAPHGISFVNAGTDWTVNAGWARDSSELAMKKQLRKGGYADLNLYFVSSMSALGYCYFPTDTDGASDDDFYYDGCTIRAATVPGGAQTNYNAGLTAVHEVGHWFGLYHTFQGGCSSVNDRVDDTPAQQSASEGCPVGRDSCPSLEGEDPIHNYMDYSYDSCYDEFTVGQQDRMYTQWDTYRASFQ